jgi:hypothetical protein
VKKEFSFQKWSHSEDYHITLFFFGEAEHQQDEIITRLEQVAAQPEIRPFSHCLFYKINTHWKIIREPLKTWCFIVLNFRVNRIIKKWFNSLSVSSIRRIICRNGKIRAKFQLKKSKLTLR